MNPRKILFKLLGRTHSPRQIIAGIVGAFLGILLFAIAIQAFIEYTKISEESDNQFGKQYTIIHKKISLLNTMSGNVSGFSDEDIQEIRRIPSVENVGNFTAGRFNVWAELIVSENFQGLKSELFFEAVEDRFIDHIPEGWGWSENEELIPMILPVDFINLYNFTFAPSRGLPLISPNTIKLARFNLNLFGEKGRKAFTGRIVGYSERINSILVPKEFLDYANEELTGMKEDETSSRLIVEIDQRNSGELYKLIKQKKWETNESQMITSKFSLLVQVVLGFVGFLGVVILLLSLSSTILYVFLVMNKAKYEIDTLLLLGVPRKYIVNWYAANIGAIYVVVLTLTCFAVWLIKTSFYEVALKYGFTLTRGIHIVTIVASFLALFILWFVQYLYIKKISES